MQVFDLLDGQFLDWVDVAAATIGNGGRRDAGPAVRVVRRELLPGAFGIGAAVGRQFAALAAGVAKLDGGHSAHPLDDRRDAGVALDLVVAPDAGAGGRGPAVGGDRHLLAEHQCEIAGCTGPKVAYVVVVQLTINRVVHRHRRHYGAVAQGHAFKRVGA